ncbi:DNA-directed RNA polymerase subunit beta'', partial [Bienertia sinuspersici]
YFASQPQISSFLTIECISIVPYLIIPKLFRRYRVVKEFRPKYQMKVDRYPNHFKYKKPSRRSSPSGEEKKKIELKIFSGDIHFPGETDRSRHSGILIPPGRANSKDSKILKNWIYVQRITPTKKIFFVLVRPVVPYEITDGINLATLFPRDLLQERDNVQLRSSSIGEARASFVEVRTKGMIRYFLRTHLVKSDISYIEKRNDPSSAKAYLATPGATIHGHYGEIIYEGDTLVTFIYEKFRSGDITQGLPKVEQVLEVRSIDSISMNLAKRIDGWNERITRILGMPWGFLIGAELTIAQSRISLVNKIQKVYRSQGVQIHNKHIEIIVCQITSKVLVSEDGITNWIVSGGTNGARFRRSDMLPSYLIGNNESISEYSKFYIRSKFSRNCSSFSKSGSPGPYRLVERIKRKRCSGGMIPVGTGFKGFVHYSSQHKGIPLKTKKKESIRERNGRYFVLPPRII